MKQIILAILAFLFMTTPSIATDGVIDTKSMFGVKETADRLEGILTDKGMTIFTRINHSKAAKNVGIELRETELIIFGNPKVGSPLMQCQQSVAIDLPQKALIWKDAQGTVWISYNEPRYLQNRHNIPDCNEIITKISNALAGITKAASEK
jgi:uncharacterized protein (DUF302 family)